MSLTFVGYDVIKTGSSDKSAPDIGAASDKAIARQLEELKSISRSERDKVLGRDYFSDIEDFYNLEDSQGGFPSYRPQVKIPQLQTLVLNEATDITDSSPKVFIAHKGEREKQREAYFQANWKQNCYNNRILESVIWSMLTNQGFLQIGQDPLARRGHGNTWIASRNPKSVYMDPYCKTDSDWSWVGWDDWMYIDEVYRRWPDKGHLVQPRVYAAASDPYGSVEGTLDFPEYSPLSQQGAQHRKIFRDNRVCVTTWYMFDNTRERVTEYAGTAAETNLLVHPRFQYAYPDGRWITECEGVILADGNNWCPQLPDDDLGTFPLVRVSAMPCIADCWGPPPVKLSRSLQRLSERVYTQTFENVVRLNNGVIVIENNTGLDPSGIGWLPGEVLMINQGSKHPEVIAPVAMPQHMMQLPGQLLALQKELQGFSAARQGEPGSGNISPDLFDAALWQSKPMTRLRARLLAESIQRLAGIIFQIQGRYQQTSQKLPEMADGELSYREWTPISSMDDYDMFLDEGSLQVLSATALKSVMAAAGKAGLLPTKEVLEGMGVPNADEIAEQKTREMELAALSKLRRPK